MTEEEMRDTVTEIMSMLRLRGSPSEGAYILTLCFFNLHTWTIKPGGTMEDTIKTFSDSMREIEEAFNAEPRH